MKWVGKLDLIKNTIWIILITAIVLSILFLINYSIVNLKPLNERLVIRQFVYSKLLECREKLGAYGEPDVDFDVSFYTVTSGELEICLEKLGAYGEPINIPLTTM